MPFYTIGNMTQKNVPVPKNLPTMWPAPTSEEGLQWWIDKMDEDPDQTLSMLERLEKKDVEWVDYLLDILVNA